MKEILTTSLPRIPDAAYAKGVSAPFCGIPSGTLVVAGGANFPDRPLLEGGTKKVYRDIWCFRDGEWRHAGFLADSTAYGACFPMEDRMILAGGNVRGCSSDRVYALSLDNGKAVLTALSPLPFPVEQAGASTCAGTLYLAGGQNGAEALDSVLACEDGSWQQIATLPQPLVQPVAFATARFLYVWGGFNPRTLLAPDQGWKLDLESLSWSQAPAVPDGGTFTGSSGAKLPDGRLLVLGGVNRPIFERALRNTPQDRIPYLSQEVEAYRFRRSVWVFDPDTERWSQLGETPLAALAGSGVAATDKRVYVSGGELKPGVRSPETFSFTY